MNQIHGVDALLCLKDTPPLGKSDGSLTGELALPLRDWLVTCGLEDERTGNAKRMLDLAHERLKAEGDLQGVGYTGRGKAGSITSTFLAAPEPEAVDRLLERGVTRPVAEALAADHPERIPAALRVIDERLRSGRKLRSLAASVVDAVRNPGKWGYAAPERAKARPTSRGKGRKPDAEPEATSDPRETVRVLLRLKLGRAPSPDAVRAVDELDEAELALVKEALTRPRDEALPLVAALLSAEL